ncbi:hypothetical protein HPB50_016237 [Hyalomma asiaticum]|uniref:Uncharacterized protein n=1 Tax=Hyalomma asiaticum TaxID=266040 RepID=A0ACB7TIQ0_HYAAI|nr:hypothetical protein HPB50_016237 [Hyalomma asiaticum]
MQEVTAVAADRLNAQDPVTNLRHSGRTGGKKKYTKPATMPSPRLDGERPNGMGNSSFDIGICVSRCTGGGRAPGFRGRILRVTGTSRVGGLQVGTLYQEASTLPENLGWLNGAPKFVIIYSSKNRPVDEQHCCLGAQRGSSQRAAAQEGIMSELQSLAQTMALQQERN